LQGTLKRLGEALLNPYDARSTSLRQRRLLRGTFLIREWESAGHTHRGPRAQVVDVLVEGGSVGRR
jgi:hypothetical protein